MSAVVWVTLAVVIGLALAVFFPGMTQRTIEVIVKAREIVSAVLFLVFAFFFIASGVDILVAIGVLMLIFATGRIYFSRDEVGEAI